MGGATNLKGGGSVHWNVAGQYSKNTKIWKMGCAWPPPHTFSYDGTASVVKVKLICSDQRILPLIKLYIDDVGYLCYHCLSIYNVY